MIRLGFINNRHGISLFVAAPRISSIIFGYISINQGLAEVGFVRRDLTRRDLVVREAWKIMSNVLEKLQEQVEKVQLLGLEKPEMFEAVRNPSLLRDAFRKIDQHHLGDCSDMRPVAQVSKHVRDLYSLLVAERDALLNEESNQAQPKVEMQEDGNGWRLHISSLKWDGAIISILETIESMGLTLVKANISCDKMFVLDAFLQEEAEEVEADMNEPNEENQP